MGNITSGESTENNCFLKHLGRPSRGLHVNCVEKLKYLLGFEYISVNNEIPSSG